MIAWMLHETAGNIDLLFPDEGIDGPKSVTEPMRRKALNGEDSSSVSTVPMRRRLNNDCVVVERTGDCLETKSLPRTSSKSTVVKKPIAFIDAETKREEKKAVELSLSYSSLGDTLAFVRAKEDFRRAVNFSGVLYR